ncbi:MAG: winged helix-turn-helix domain-containing protein [Vicinamibacterales bacterium]
MPHAELRLQGVGVELTPKSTQVLAYLFQQRPRTVSRTELMSRIWPDVVVSKGSLTQAIWEIRRALDDARATPRFIATDHGLGYRFVATVCRVDPGAVRQSSITLIGEVACP